MANTITTVKDSKDARAQKIITRIILLVIFSIAFVLIMLPFYAITLASFKPGADIIKYGLNLDFNLDKMNLNNFKYLFTGDHSYWMWFKNSLLLVITQVFLTLLISAFVAYGFAAYDFKFKNFLFICVLLIMMVPFEILLMPLYVLVNDLHMYNSYSAIIIPGMANASTIFFFRQYLQGIPKALQDAGRVDGATEYGIFFKIILPIMKPSFAAMAILNGMGSWNNLLWPFMVLGDGKKFTLPIGLKTLLTPYGNNYDLLIVGSFFAIFPIFILFLCFQSYFIDGMTAGAVKG